MAAKNQDADAGFPCYGKSFRLFAKPHGPPSPEKGAFIHSLTRHFKATPNTSRHRRRQMSTAEHNAALWEDKYAAGHMEHAPWDACVAFIFRNRPRDRERRDVHILETGCGTAPNLFFAAQQGFCVAGIDISASAIDSAKARFAKAGLKADLRVGDFHPLPFGDSAFDLAMDRGALSYADIHDCQKAVREIRRALKPGGKFLFTPYSDRHTSAKSGLNTSADQQAAQRRFGGYRGNITQGGLLGTGRVFVYSLSDVERVLPAAEWDIASLIHVEETDLIAPLHDIHAHWRVVAARK